MVNSYHVGMLQPQLPEPDYAEPQRHVQRWLGRCMLSLQQAERLLKTLLAEKEVLWVYDPQSAAGSKVLRRFSQDQVKLKTLGGLVTDFCGDVLNAADNTQKRLVAPEGKLSFSWNFSVEVDSERWAEIERGMRDMVALRNECVHHLVERFDLCSLQGCQDALVFLEQAYEKAESFREQIRGYEYGMMAARDAIKDIPMEAIIRGEPMPLKNTSILAAVISVFHGLLKDEQGAVAWSVALENLGKQFPEETPNAYGYKSWEHLIHASGVFKMMRKDAQGTQVAPRLRCLSTYSASTG